MAQGKLEFEARTSKITIDYDRCEPATKNTPNPSCGFACIKADRCYGRNVLKIEGNRPVLASPNPEEIRRLCNECLACEYDCWLYGAGCIHIEIPFPDLDAYKEKVRTGKRGE
ncbi:MAG TPA: hypothetical protein G4O03_07125 [Dehalococcoidia bacterium]|jgi:hypothetical protein|nr:hypothetical protein [Dehalococcoidia bacterium]